HRHDIAFGEVTMNPKSWQIFVIAIPLFVERSLSPGALAAPPDVPLPDGVKAVWDLEKASREKTPTRERICLNGLWRWQPGAPSAKSTDGASEVPTDKWGFFKVPGFWPGNTNYIQEDCQTLFAHPDWKNNLRDVTSGWYQREITIPEAWLGKRITLSAE